MKHIALVAFAIVGCSNPTTPDQNPDASNAAAPDADTSGTGSGSGSGSSSNQTLLQYLASQSPANGGGILDGQYVQFYASKSGGMNPLEDFFHDAPNDASHITVGKSETGQPSTDTGLAPAILGFELTKNDGDEIGLSYTTYKSLPYAQTFQAAGGIVFIGGWALNPIATSVQINGTVNADAMLNNPNSAEYKAWHTHLDRISNYIKQIPKTVLYRPFVEPNLNGSFWWDRSNFSATQQKQLYIQEWQYFRDAGVTNVLWVFNANAGVGGYVDSYPGDEYVDLVSMDAYPIQSDAKLGGMYAAMTTPSTTVTGVSYSATKPIFFAEAGSTQNFSNAYQSANWDSLRSLVATQMPKVFAIMSWFQGEQPSNQLGEQAFMQNTITLHQLPAY